MKQNIFKRSMAALLGLTLTIPQMFSPVMANDIPEETSESAAVEETKETGAFYLGLNEGGTVTFDLQDGSKIQFSKQSDGTVLRTKGKKMKILEPNADTVLAYEGTVGEEVFVSVQPDETHEANNMSVWVNEQKREIGENPTTLKVEQNDQILLVSFTEKQEEQEEESSENSEEESEDEDDSEPPQTDEEKDESDPVEETSESNSSEESSHEPDEPADPFEKIAEDSILSKAELKKIDFSSKRLLVAGDESLILDPEHILSSYDGVYLLQYDDEKTARNAFSYYYGKAAFVDVDGVVSTASGESGAVGSSEMTEDENPIAELESAVDENPGNVKGTVIALIDTGVNDMTGVVEAVSMIGDDPSDSNGHGTAMAGYIHSVNPDAKILSIKALGADGTGDASAVYAAIEYAISRKASIINLSITAARKLENTAVITAIEEAQANGIQVVGAAGNKAKKADYYVPGCVTGAYIIGACDEHGQKIPSSNYGDTVDFNVVAESTSEAAAKFSGYLSMGKNEADEILVFPTSYEYKEPEPEKPEDPEPGEEETEETVTLKLQIRHGGHAFITYDDKKTELWKDQDGTMNHEGELSFDSDESDLFFTGTFPKNAQVSLDVAPNSDYEMTLYRINDQPASGSHQDLVLSSDTEVNIGFSPADDGRFVIAANPEPDVADGYETTGSYEILWTNNMTGSGTMADRFELELTSGTLEGYVGYFDCVSPGVASGRVGFTGSYYAKATVTESGYTKTTSWYIYAYGPYGFNLYTQMNETHQDMLGDYSYSKAVEPKKGGIEIQKNDEDMDAETAQGAASLKGIKFAVVNKTGDVADVGGTDYADGKVVRILTTDAKGHAATSNKLLPEGKYAVYELRSDATIEVGDTYEGSKKLGSSDMANTYYRFGSNSKTVTVKADSLVKATFENPILRGGLKVIKKDAETKNGDPQGNSSIKGIRFAVVNSTGGTVKVGSTIFADGKVVRIITANADGEAATSATLLPYGTYYVYELRQDATIEAGDTYEGSKKLGSSDMANDDYEFKANSKKFTVNSQGELKEVSFTNKPKRGGITIQKKINGLKDGAAQADGSLKGIRFAVVNNSTNPVVISDTEYAKGKVVSIITTNKDGLAKTSATLLPKGSYEVYELRQDATIEVGDTYEGSKKLGSSDLANDTVVFKANHATVKVTPGSTTDAPDAVFDNDEVSGKAKVGKTNPDTKTAVEGDASPEGIKVAVVNGSAEAVAYDGKEIAKGEVVTILSLNAKGEATTEDLPYGKYTLYELRSDATIKTGETYSGSSKLGSSDLANDKGYLYKVQHESVEIHKDGEVKAVAFEDPIIHGDVKIEKWDKILKRKVPQGDADFSGIQFEIKNASANPVVVGGKTYAVGEKVATLTTDEKGDAATTGKLLPYGTYTIQEVKSNDKYRLTDGTERTFQIRKDGETVTTSEDNNSLHFDNEVVSGKVSLSKTNPDTKTAVEGDASPAGIKIAVVNDSANVVKIGSAEYSKGQVIAILVLDNAGNSELKDLPYGTYTLHELRDDASISIGDSYVGSKKLGTSDLANNNGYLFKEQSKTVTLTKDGETKSVGFEDPIIHGDVKIEKWDKDLGRKAAQGDADFSGIQFEIKNASKNAVVVSGKSYAVGEVVKTLTTDAKGDAATTGKLLPYGTYTIQEVKTNDKYLLTDGTLRTFVIRNEAETVTTSTDKNSLHFDNVAVKGSISVQKDDKERASGETQGDADLSGIRFAIVNESEKLVKVNGKEYEPGKVVTIITTNAKGKASTAKDLLPYGTYHVYELRQDAAIEAGDTYEGSDKLGSSIYANASYLFAANEQKIEVRENSKMYPVSFTNEVVHGGVKVGKIDRETDTNVPQGLATLKDAQFTIYNNSERPVMVGKVEYKVGEKIRSFTSDEEGLFETAADLLPYGTYVVKETKPPVGYLPNTTWQVTFQIREEGVIVDTTTEEGKTEDPDKSGWLEVKGGSAANPAEVPDDIIRGDVTFKKVDIDGYPMPGIPFVIQRLDAEGNVVESHVIVSDENGLVSTKDRKKTDEKVNSLDQYMKDGVFTDDSMLDGKTGVWFGEQSARDESRGALIYANYMIKELRCKANEGQDLLKTDEPVEIRENNREVSLSNTLVDLNIRLESEAMDVTSDSKVVTYGTNVELSDTVSYIHLKVYNEYELITSFYNIRKDGKNVKLGEGSITFTPEQTDNTKTAYGEVTNTVTVDTTKAEPGSEIVAVDQLYKYEDGKKTFVASHNMDCAVESQKLFVPEMKTEASDSKTKDHVGTAEVEASIADILKYKNLADQKIYLVTANLKNAETGEEVAEPVTRLLRINYKDTEVSQKMLYWQGPKDGTLIMPAFVFDASAMEGKTLVVTETLTDMDSGEVILTHEALDDKDQQVHYILVRTEAKDGITESHVGTVTEKATVVDQVTIENAIIGETYIITGSLVYQEDCTDADGVSHKAGDIIAEHEPVEVIAEDTTIVKDLVFTLDASKLEGLSGTVFEDVYHKNILVGTHHDIHSEPQTIHWPKVRTTATDGETKTHTGVVGEKATIIDEVNLTNLMVGETYTMRGTLKTSAGEDFLVEGNPLMVSQEFTATAKEMTIPMEFTFNSNELSGRSLVVFEELFHGDVEVARHEDKDDKGQTISYPDAKTNAADSSTQDQVGMVTETDTIIDTVSYHNLVVGETYTIKGQLMYKEPFADVNHLVHQAGDPVLDKEGNPITAETTFEASEQTGAVDLIYTLDSSLLKGSTVIVFEDIYSNGVKVFSHADLEDEDQSVWYPSVRTMAIDTVTEDHVGTTGHDAMIRDTVELKNLKVGETYKVYGTLMDKDTREAIVDANGANITAESDEFVAESRDMTITMEFTLDASIRENMTTVVFEELIHKDVVVAAHAEIGDEGQSIHHPAVHTTATDEETGEHVGRAREKTVIHDTVKLYNMIPGMTYELEGYLVDSDSGKPYLDADGNEVRVHTEPFIAERGKEDTEMILTFTFNGANLEGKSVTVFEDLYHGGHIVAAHRLKGDKDQMVDYPEIHTIATDQETGDHISKAGEKVTIIDEVTYTNLRPGLTYKVKGVLMNKQTGKALKVNGEKITAEKEFTPEKKDGSVKLEFTFDASALAGETVVVFEDVNYNEIEVAVHHDIEDEDQTVVIPSVRTTVVDKADGDRKVKPDSQVTLVDTVYLSGLLAGRQYRVYGQVMNKKTGEVLMDGKNQVEAMSDVFTADGPEMEIDVAFDFTIHGIEDTDLVIFEKLMMLDNENNEEIEVGSHENWDDKDQTVYVEKSPRPHNPKTGDTTRVYIPLLMMVVSLAGIISLVVFKRKLR